MNAGTEYRMYNETPVESFSEEVFGRKVVMEDNDYKSAIHLLRQVIIFKGFNVSI